MNMNNYTIKSQEAVQAAVQLAQEKGQQAIETGHLLRKAKTSRTLFLTSWV